MTEPTPEVEISWTRFGPTFYCAYCCAAMREQGGFLIHPEEAGRGSRKPGFSYCPHLNKWFKRPFYRIPVVETAKGQAEARDHGFLGLGLLCAAVILLIGLIVPVYDWLSGQDPFRLTKQSAPVAATTATPIASGELGVAITPRAREAEELSDGEDGWIVRVLSIGGRLYVNPLSDVETLPSWKMVHIKKVKGGYLVRECRTGGISEVAPGSEESFRGSEIIGRFE